MLIAPLDGPTLRMGVTHWRHAARDSGGAKNVETEMCAGGGHLTNIGERDPGFGCTEGN
jgi:hypothetical protein